MKQLWLNREWGPSLRQTIKGFIRTHNRWMTVSGAAIVFAMFVVKDAYREELKDVVGLISAAQNRYVIQSSVTISEFQTDSLVLRLASLVESMQKKTPKEEIFYKMFRDMRNQSSTIVYLKNDLRNVCALIKGLSTHTEQENACKQIECELKVLGKQLDEMSDKTNNGAITIDLTFPEKVIELASQEEDLHKRIIESAETERSKREQRVKHATLASYILYPFGWGIALLGKLYGKGEGPELE